MCQCQHLLVKTSPNSDTCALRRVGGFLLLLRIAVLPWAERHITDPRVGLDGSSYATREVVHLLRYHAASGVFKMDLVPRQKATLNFSA